MEGWFGSFLNRFGGQHVCPKERGHERGGRREEGAKTDLARHGRRQGKRRWHGMIRSQLWGTQLWPRPALQGRRSPSCAPAGRAAAVLQVEDGGGLLEKVCQREGPKAAVARTVGKPSVRGVQAQRGPRGRLRSGGQGRAGRGTRVVHRGPGGMGFPVPGQQWSRPRGPTQGMAMRQGPRKGQSG